MKREEGYYWVKEGEEWKILFFREHCQRWSMSEQLYPDHYFDEIDERRIVREDSEIKQGKDIVKEIVERKQRQYNTIKHREFINVNTSANTITKGGF